MQWRAPFFNSYVCCSLLQLNVASWSLSGEPDGTTKGLQVYDIHAKRWHTHVPFAPVVSADTPARAKFGGFLAPAAFIACFHCEFEGYKYEDAKQGTYFAGYAQPSPLDVAGDGEEVFAWDAPQKSDAVHRTNCREVEGEDDVASEELVAKTLNLPLRNVRRQSLLLEEVFRPDRDWYRFDLLQIRLMDLI